MRFWLSVLITRPGSRGQDEAGTLGAGPSGQPGAIWRMMAADTAGGRMKTRAAVLRDMGKDWEIVELDLDPPKDGEVLVRFAAAGLCHSDEHSCVKIDDDLPLETVALVGCGVPTGWGTAVNAGGVRPGDTTVIYGIGGVGINAVQGAAFAGARNVIAVDPLEFKREHAMEFGATHVAADAAAAQELVTELTRGVGADQALITVGVGTEEVVAAACA